MTTLRPVLRVGTIKSKGSRLVRCFSTESRSRKNRDLRLDGGRLHSCWPVRSIKCLHSLQWYSRPGGWATALPNGRSAKVGGAQRSGAAVHSDKRAKMVLNLQRTIKALCGKSSLGSNGQRRLRRKKEVLSLSLIRRPSPL